MSAERGSDPGWVQQLEAWLRDHEVDARVTSVSPLTGGACQDNFRVALTVEGIPRVMALRSDARRSLPGSLDRATEYAVVCAAVEAGVPTPAARWLIPDLLREGSHAYLMDWVDGVAIGARILKEPALAVARRALPGQLAAALARIHAITPDRHPLVIATPQSAGAGEAPEAAALRFCHAMMAELPEPHPAMELALRWLDERRPPPAPRVLVHGDFRLGNFLVGEPGLQAVLDWEFAHWGSRAADVGWMCVRDWRFGRLNRPAAGLTSRSAFYGAYAAASGLTLDPAEVHWWEVMGNTRWAAGAVYQSERVLSGQEQDLELLAIGRRAAEMEYEALRLIALGPPRIEAPSIVDG